MAFTPPTSAASHSSAQMLRTAMDSATSDDEHAVSTARLGPLRSSKYEMRFAAMLIVMPVFVWASQLTADSPWIPE